MSKAECFIVHNGIDFIMIVDFDATEGAEATWDDPGYDSEVDITDGYIKVDGEPTESMEEINAVLKESGRLFDYLLEKNIAKIEERALEVACEDARDDMFARAEFAYECKRDDMGEY